MAGSALRWFVRDAWEHHQRPILTAFLIGLGGVSASSLGLALLAHIARSLGRGGWTALELARFGIESRSTPLVAGGALLACLGAGSALSFWSASRVVDVTQRYRERCSQRALRRLMQMPESSGDDPDSRRAASRLVGADVLASARSLRALLALAPAILMLGMALVILVWLHPGATLALVVLGLPFASRGRRLVAAVEGIARTSEDPEASRELRSIVRSAPAAAADRADVLGQRLAASSQAQHQTQLLERFRLEDQGRLLTETFGTLALVALLLLAPTDEEGLGTLLAFLVVLRVAAASLQGVFSGAAHLARFMPSLHRHHRAIVGGLDRDPPHAPGREEAPRDSGPALVRAPRGGPPPTVFHVTHHKAGSQWVYAVLKYLQPDRIVPPQVKVRQLLHEPLRAGSVYPTIYLDRSRFERVSPASPQRVFVVMRDLRDALVSLYFSVRFSHPMLRPGHVRQRRRLEAMGVHEGMRSLLITGLSRTARFQESWLGHQNLFRYEDLVARPVDCFSRIAWICEFDVEEAHIRNAVRDCAFETLSGRPVGEEDVRSHFRKGTVGDWREHFDDELRDEFKRRYGSLLVRAGYEKDDAW